jgi:hypothetical protein
MKKKKTLLDLDRVPTLDELRVFFRENDFSAATYMDLDYYKLPTEQIEFIERAKKLMGEHWEPLSREMGLKSGSANYGDDNPLIALRDNMENLAATGVLKLITEKPERATEILAEFNLDSDPDIEKHANDFLHNAVETLMKVTDYESLAQIVQEAPAHEDFNPRLKPNYREQDFDRKWQHSRTGVKTEPLDSLNEEDIISDDITDAIIANEQLNSFWDNLSDEDKKLLQMKMSGASQKDIAKALGLQTQGAVSKRLAKLKEHFIAGGE